MLWKGGCVLGLQVCGLGLGFKGCGLGPGGVALLSSLYTHGHLCLKDLNKRHSVMLGQH